MMISCKELAEIIKTSHFKIIGIHTDNENECLIDFKHPKISGFPYNYFASSVWFDKKNNVLITTVRGKANMKELYLDYCCENGEMVCRPHFDFENKVVSIEAKFHEEPIQKFKQLLTEML